MSKLKDICYDMHQGINTVADKVEYFEKGYPILQSKNITKGILDIEDVKYVDEKTYNYYKEKYNPQENDILLANIGTIGKSIIVKEQNNFLIAWNIFLIKINKEKMNPRYLKLFFDYLFITKYYDKFLTGGTVKFINKKTMGEIDIPDIEIEEQEKIVNKIEKVQDIIQLKKLQLEKLNELIKSQFVEMFENCENKDLIGNVIEICRGASPRPINNFITEDADGINWIKIGDVSENSLYITNTKEKITKDGAEKSREVFPGDFILSNSMSFGRPYILKIHGCVHDGWLIMSNFSKTFNELYLYYAIRDDEVQNQFRGKVNGATVKNLNSDLVKNTYIKIPSMNLQNQFAEVVKLIDKQKFEIQESLDEMQNLYESLMNEYFG